MIAQAFKTNSYTSRQPPPAPEQGFNEQPAFSNENARDGVYERPVRTSERPRSRRLMEADKKYVPTNMEPSQKISPRRMKQSLYQDSEEVSSKRLEASKERQKEYNDYLKFKVCLSLSKT